LYQKLCHFEFPCTLCDQMTITPQPFIIWTWIRTFWKGEKQIYNFHVHQKSIWNIFDIASQVESGPKLAKFGNFEL
jgi:hypothetical protein